MRAKILNLYFLITVLSIIACLGFCCESYAGEKSYLDPKNELNIDISKKYDYESMVKDLELLKNKYSDLIEVEVIGKSVDNRDIYLIKLGKGENKSLMLGGVHAREIQSTPLIMKMINDYCKSYYNNENYGDFQVKYLLDNTTIYIVPLVNPDGLEIALKGEDGIRNEEIRTRLREIPGYYIKWKANARGVDLNRNFSSVNWGYDPSKGVSLSYNTCFKPNYRFFGGYKPASEPETQAIENLIRQNNFKILFDIHSRGRVIYWYKPVKSIEFNNKTKQIAQEVSKYTGYNLIKSTSTPGDGTDGTMTDFGCENGIYSLTIETMPANSNFPLKVEDIVKEWDRFKYIGLVLSQETLKIINN